MLISRISLRISGGTPDWVCDRDSTGGEYRGVRHDRHFKMCGSTFAAGQPENAKLSDVLEHLNET
jgi:hypothetical protein